MSRRVGWLFLSLALAYVAFEAVASTAFDFRAFYCAGTAAAAHADPYLTQPLHSCEVSRTDGTFSAFARAVTLPAPLPGYDIAAFVPLSHMPFAGAKALWTIVLACAAAAAILALSKVTSLPAAFVFSLLWLSLIFPSLAYGELIPVSIAGVCIAAWCAREGRWACAAIGALVALAEPHIGLPVCLALAVWQPRARLPLLAGGAALGALSIATLGVQQNLEYFASVLPMHAVSELGSDAQLSLSVILHYAGVPDAAATAVGAASYAAMAVISIRTCGIVARRLSNPAYIVALPAALSVIGGSFIHVTDFAAALPLALLVSNDIPRMRSAIVTAVILLALPWWQLALVLHQGLSVVIVMAAAVAFYAGWKLTGQHIAAACVFATAAAALLAGTNHWYVQSSDAYHRTAPVVRITIDRRYPEASWAWVTQKFISTGLPASWVLRLPSWSGVIIVTCSALSASRRRSMELLYD